MSTTEVNLLNKKELETESTKLNSNQQQTFDCYKVEFIELNHKQIDDDANKAKQNKFLEENSFDEKYSNDNLSLNSYENLTILERFKIKSKKYRNYTDAISVRLTLLILQAFFIYTQFCIYKSFLILLLYVNNLIIIIDGVYVIYKRKGMDHYWFSFSIFAYSLNMLICIIMTDQYKWVVDDFDCGTNRTVLEYQPNCRKVSINICRLKELMFVTFLIIIIFTRWLLPRPLEMSEEASYSQITSFTSGSADVIDFADYMQIKEVYYYKELGRVIQVVFGLSLIQFSFSLAATKKRNINLVGLRKYFDMILSNESWSLLLVLVTQDLPCFILRIIIMTRISFDKNYSLFFFTVKNGVMVILEIYRVGLLIKRQIKKERKILQISKRQNNKTTTEEID